MTKAHTKASISTRKPSSTQEPTSFRARHFKLILQQSRNITLSTKIQVAKSHTKPIDTSKLTTGHFTALQREEIQLHPPGHRHKFPAPGNFHKPLVQPHPQEQTPQYRRTMNIQSTEWAPQTQQSKQSERHRNTQLVKEYVKYP